MQIALHAGAHMTDDNRLLACLLRNQGLLSQHGTHVPSPRSYQRLIQDSLQDARTGVINDQAGARILDAISFDDKTERLVLSNHNFFGTEKMGIAGGTFYASAVPRLDALQKIFPQDSLELFLGIRNPASFIPAMFNNTRFNSLTECLNNTDPAEVQWSDMIHRLRHELPDLSITLWCNEDTPLIWARVVQQLAGLDPSIAFEGEFDLMMELMSDAGVDRFSAFLEKHPDMTETQKRRVTEAFLDKFAEDDAIEEEIDMPGWNDGVVDHLTRLYDQDVEAIENIPGITFIAP